MSQHADTGALVVYAFLLAAAVFLTAVGENVSRRIRDRKQPADPRARRSTETDPGKRAAWRMIRDLPEENL